MYSRQGVIVKAVYIGFIGIWHLPLFSWSLRQFESVDELLHDSLFMNYRPQLRPLDDFNGTIYTDLKMRIDSIIDLDSKEQSLVVLAEIQFCWREPRLSWSLSDGPQNYVAPTRSVWTPDIVIRNSLSTPPIDVSGSARPYLYNYGAACLKFFSKIETSCSIDVRRFPFDAQVCQIQVSIPRSSFDRVKFSEDFYTHGTQETQSGDWVLHSITIGLLQTSNEFVAEEIMAITIKVSRQYRTHLVNTLLPLMGLFFLNPFVFLTPVGHGERIGFSTSLLLSYAVTISALTDVLPGSTEHVCYLSIMASVCFFVSGFIAMLVIIISRVEQRQGLYQNIWGLVILHIFSDKRKELRINNKVDVKEKNIDDLCNSPVQFCMEWHDVASCLNRMAFWFTMFASTIIVATFMALICT